MKFVCWLGILIGGWGSLVAKEVLTYSIDWGKLSVARAVLEFGENEAFLSIETVGVANWIYPVNHKLQSRFEDNSGRPLLYRQRSREGRGEKHNRDILTEFLWDVGYTRGFQRGSEPLEPIELEEGVHDPLTMLLSFCERDLQTGETISVKVSDGRRLKQYTVTVGEAEKVDTAAGSIWARRLIPVVGELGGVYATSKDPTLTIWVSQEAPHIPVRFESRVRVGSFQASLEQRTRTHTWYPLELATQRKRER